MSGRTALQSYPGPVLLPFPSVLFLAAFALRGAGLTVSHTHRASSRPPSHSLPPAGESAWVSVRTRHFFQRQRADEAAEQRATGGTRRHQGGRRAECRANPPRDGLTTRVPARRRGRGPRNPRHHRQQSTDSSPPQVQISFFFPFLFRRLSKQAISFSLLLLCCWSVPVLPGSRKLISVTHVTHLRLRDSERDPSPMQFKVCVQCTALRRAHVHVSHLLTATTTRARTHRLQLQGRNEISTRTR